MRTLLVEDEPRLRQQLTDRLRRHGHVVKAAATGREGVYYGLEYPVDLAIIDLGLPDMDGMEVVRQLRREGREYPILILTARSRWQEKVDGLESGADDYLTKPFQFEELHARMSALHRRSAGYPVPVLSNGPLRIDTRSQDVFVDDTRRELTAFEYRLLKYFVSHAGKVVSKGELTDYLYADDQDRDSNVIEVFVRRLRKKLDPDGQYRLIQTLRGRGYRFGCDIDCSGTP